MKYSLVIPCYNEEKNIPLLLERCASLINGNELINNNEIEVILVDNGSSDNTSEVLNNLLPKYPACRTIRVEKNQGYGFGILSGLNAAKGDILGWTHADMQTDPLDALNGFVIFEQNKINTFVKGKREGRPIGDVLFTIGMSFFESILLGRFLWDINAQPTIFSRSFFESWDSPPHDFSLDLYAYFKAKESGLNVKRFTVNFDERVHGISHWNINWLAKWKFIKRTIAFSLSLKRSSH